MAIQVREDVTPIEGRRRGGDDGLASSPKAIQILRENLRGADRLQVESARARFAILVVQAVL